MSISTASSSTGRFQWLDSVKGIAVIWIVLYHFLLSYGSGSLPWPISFSSFFDLVNHCGQASILGKFSCALETLIAAIIQRGPHAVGVFILFSGFGLAHSLVKRGGPKGSWTLWYVARFKRLFPVYWLAHFVFLVSPFILLHDRIDYRFLLSLAGDRIYPIDKMFFYLVPAWWFLGLLIQLYLVFPLLFKLMQRMGCVKYLGICIFLDIAARYFLTMVEANGYYEMGGLFFCRLWEFAAGMALGKLMAEKSDATLGLLLSWKGFFAGAIIYALGLFADQPTFLYYFSDGLTAMGLTVILINVAYHLSRTPALGSCISRAGIYSYGIYLFHQPYVMYAGEKFRPYSLAGFLALASAVTLLIVLGSICLEYSVNRTVNPVVEKILSRVLPQPLRKAGSEPGERASSQCVVK